MPTCTLHEEIEPHLGKEKQLRPSFHSLHDGTGHSSTFFPTHHSPLSSILMQRDILFLKWRILSVRSHAARRGAILIVIHILHRVVSGAFSLRILGFGVNFTHAQVGSLFFLPHCDLCKLFQWLRCFKRAIVSPHLLVVVAVTFWGCCRLLGNHFGHDRAKNNSKVVFPCPSGNCWLTACMQWLVFGLCWEWG